MPYQYIEPDIYLEHNGVTVWHFYRDGTDEPWEYWFTTSAEQADNDHGDGAVFDARVLAGRWSDTPSIAEWDGYWRPRFRTEHDAIEALIKGAIEDGRIPRQARAA